MHLLRRSDELAKIDEVDQECHRAGALEALDHPWQDWLNLRWWEARVGGRLPAREAVDPIDLRFCLGYLVLWDVPSEGLDVRYRLCGTQIASLLGRDLTGRHASSLPGPLRHSIEHCMEACLDHLEPVLCRTTVMGRAYVRHWSRLILPYAQVGDRPSLVMVLSLPSDFDDTAL